MGKEFYVKKDLANLLHNRFGIPKPECFEFVNSIFQEMTDKLAKGEQVKIPSFGTFQVKFQASKDMYDMNTGKERTTEAKYKVRFIPSDKLKQQVNRG